MERRSVSFRGFMGSMEFQKRFRWRLKAFLGHSRAKGSEKVTPVFKGASEVFMGFQEHLSVYQEGFEEGICITVLRGFRSVLKEPGNNSCGILGGFRAL